MSSSSHLKSVSKKVRSLLLRADRSDVEARYEISVLLCGILESAKYGKKAIESMEVEIGLSHQSLYRIAKVARAWPKVEFASVSKKRNSKGWPLTWSHWQVLATVKDESLRESLLRRALDESLTVEEVEAEAKAKKQGETEAATGVEASESPPFRFDVELSRWVGAFEKELVEWRDKLPGDVKTAASEMDDVRLARLKETLERLATAGESVAAMADELKRVVEKEPFAAPVAPFVPPTFPPPPPFGSAGQG